MYVIVEDSYKVMWQALLLGTFNHVQFLHFMQTNICHVNGLGGFFISDQQFITVPALGYGCFFLTAAPLQGNCWIGRWYVAKPRVSCIFLRLPLDCWTHVDPTKIEDPQTFDLKIILRLETGLKISITFLIHPFGSPS